MMSSYQPMSANVRKPEPDESRLSPDEIAHGLRTEVLKPKRPRKRPAKERRDLKPERQGDGYETKGMP